MTGPFSFRGTDDHPGISSDLHQQVADAIVACDASVGASPVVRVAYDPADKQYYFAQVLGFPKEVYIISPALSGPWKAERLS